MRVMILLFSSYSLALPMSTPTQPGTQLKPREVDLVK